MAGVRSLLCRSISAAVNPCSRSARFYGSCMNVSKFCFQYLPTVSGFSLSNKCKTVDWQSRHMGKTRDKSIALSFLLNNQQRRSDTSRQYSTKCSQDFQLRNTILHSHCAPVPLFTSASSHIRAYSSHVGGEQNGPKNATAVPSTAATESTEKTTDASEWMEALNQACKSVVDAVVNAGQRVKEVSDEVAVPYIHQLYESHPYLENVIVPVCGTLSATILAWVVMPKILKKFHKYATQSPLTLLARSSPNDQVPYEKSFWSALEDPARYLVTFMAFSQLGVLIAPSASQYLSQAWRGAVVLSFIWFLQRWKTTFFARALTNEVSVGLERDRLLALEKVSSVGLLVLGVMALAEACGVAVQSILTVGGIGGVATAFAARDILGNLLSGLSLQFSKPFSLGDNIKAGSIEGQVVEMGLTTTSLINPEKFPVIVPNSLFSSQVIVNKSRAQWRASTIKIPLRIDDLEKIPLVSKEIKSMLCSHPKVLQDIDAPYCYLSRLENLFGELTVGCNLKNMKKGELFATEQDILLQAARIIRQHGAELGSTRQHGAELGSTIHQSIDQ